MDAFSLIKALSIIAALLISLYGALLLIKKKQLQQISIKGHSISILAHKNINKNCAVTVLEIDGQNYILANQTGALVLKKLQE